MGGGSTISSDAVVALSQAIDAALERGDEDEAARLGSLQGAELDRWLQAHGYLRLKDDEERVSEGSARLRGNLIWPIRDR